MFEASGICSYFFPIFIRIKWYTFSVNKYKRFTTTTRDLIFMVRDVKASKIYGGMSDQHDGG